MRMRGVEPPHNNSLSVAPLPVGVHTRLFVPYSLSSQAQAKGAIPEVGFEPYDFLILSQAPLPLGHSGFLITLAR